MTPPEGDRKTIQVTLAGRSYRLSTTVPESEIKQLAVLVGERIEALSRGRQTIADAAVIAAILFAHEAEHAKSQLEKSRRETRQRIRATISKIEQLEHRPQPSPEDDAATDD